MKQIVLVFLALLTSGHVFGQNTGGASAEYHLKPGDSIEIVYRYTPEFDQTATVQPDGTVSLQIVGDIKLGGLTVNQAQHEVLNQAGQRLLNPEVSIALKDFDGPHYTVLGEVGKPGRFELRGDLSPIDAVSIAGGFKSSSKHTQIVLIHRIGPTTGEAELLNFNRLEHLKTAKGVDDFPKLRNGDLIVVPERKLSRVERLIKLAGIGVYYPL